MPSLTDIVVISLEGWDTVWRRNQHLVAGLMNDMPDLRVLFVEPSVDPLYAMTRGHRPSMGRGLRARSDPYVGGRGRLWTLEPTKWLPRRVDPTLDRRFASQVFRASQRLGMEQPILWVNDPAGAEVMMQTGWPTMYDVTDDWLMAERSAAEHDRLQTQESALLKSSAEVVVCSPALAGNKGRDRQVHLIPNAVDLAQLRLPRARPLDLPAGPVAVYVGTVHGDRMDLELCAATARTIGELGKVVLVGPAPLADTDSKRLQAAGVCLLGARPREQVPAYLQHANVLVVPHLVNDFTDSLDPIKAYEYKAVNRPVVATPVAGFRDEARTGLQVVSRSDFPKAVSEALVRPSGHWGFTEPADVPDWAQRVQQMKRVLQRVAAE